MSIVSLALRKVNPIVYRIVNESPLEFRSAPKFIFIVLHRSLRVFRRLRQIAFEQPILCVKLWTLFAHLLCISLLSPVDVWNSEKRKEKSRDAADVVAARESEIFSDLSSQLPLPQGTAAALDKTSVMRLTVGYLKVREMVELFIAPYNHKCRLAISEKLAPKDNDMFKQLDGFFLVLSEEGDVIHLSENVEQFIGIPQVEMLGQSVFEFSHPCDHDEIRAILTAKVPVNGESPTTEKDFFSILVRMKSTIKTKGRAVNLKSATYQVIHYNGHKMGIPKWLATDKCSTVMVLIFGKPVPHPAQIDVPLDTDIFISRHSPDMKFTHIDERITEFLGYKSSELIGKSVYSYYHSLDVLPLLEAFKTTSIVSQKSVEEKKQLLDSPSICHWEVGWKKADRFSSSFHKGKYSSGKRGSSKIFYNSRAACKMDAKFPLNHHTDKCCSYS
ncbi:hypoxia-inducible factor 1-alpha [Caerostris extrusa]|uniref:Hypoxia-inducible factor 1-alpha n=1 Tax=Caerostris extrusa TaxID=172846 RepID=A0AAV4MNJ1_CAEEX|nr:hypoxia-inducible factor 1-alpha [Caerostris extrusa]